MRRRNTILGSLALAGIALFPALAPAPRAKDDSAELKKLAEAKASVARKVVDFSTDVRLGPPGNPLELPGIPGGDQVEFWTRRLVDARLDAAPGKTERVAILADEVGRTKAIEARIKDLGDLAGGFGKIEGFKAEFNRLDAEYRLLKETSGL